MELKEECPMPECTQKTTIQIIGSDVKEIKDALLGNSYNNNKGFIFKVNEHDKKLENIEKRIAFYSGVSSIIGFAAGFILEKILK